MGRSMKEIYIPDSQVGSKKYVKELAQELTEAWVQDKHQYVFDTLSNSPFVLSVAVYHLLPNQEDKTRFLVRCVAFCKTGWPIDDLSV